MFSVPMRPGCPFLFTRSLLLKKFSSRNLTMRRVHALFLFIAMMANPIAAMASAILQPSTCCCCGEMCPMHRPSHSQDTHGRKLCGGKSESSQPCNMGICNCNHRSDFGILFFVEAVLTQHQVVSILQQTPFPGLSAYTAEPARTMLPPEQPPRL